jgi:hypothetical protein
MGYEIRPNVERKSSAGLVLTHDEMVAAVKKDVMQRRTPAGSYETEVVHSVHNIAITAEWLGKNACGRDRGCELECSGVSLVEQNSLYDGQVRATCKKVDCDDTGIMVAFAEFTRHEL